MTESQINVLAIADCLFSFRLKDDLIRNLSSGVVGLLEKCKKAASIMRNPNDSVPFDDSGSPPSHGELQVLRSSANNVIDVVDDLNNFVARARASGFAPPSNPISEIVRFNETRRVKNGSIVPETISNELADDLQFNLRLLLDLIDKEKDGELDFDGQSKTTAGSAAQISSYTMPIGAFEFASEGTIDLLSFIPDVDKIKRSRIKDALGALDFKNRVPKIVFTANYDPDGISQGVIVGWKRIPDASSYVFRRHSLFDNSDEEFEISKDEAVVQYGALKDYVSEWVLSFYEHFNENSIYAFLDKDVSSNNFYSYTLRAAQNVRRDNGYVFNVDVVPFSMSFIQLNDIEQEIRSYAAQVFAKKLPGVTSEDVSPYPFLSKKFYGHDKFDWLIAAMNVKASIERGDDRATVRNYSYVDARFSFIREQIENNNFYRPSNPNEIVSNLRESISSFGVSQTLTDVITSTGLDLFFSSKESPTESGFKRASAVFDDRKIGGMLSIFSAIDTETATIDVDSLVGNLLLISQSSNDELDEASSPIEVDVPSVKDDAVFAEDSLQFVGDFDPSKEFIDLTTFEGVSEFVRIIRLFFDLSPNRRSFTRSSTSSIQPPTKGGTITTPDGEKSDIGDVFDGPIKPGFGDDVKRPPGRGGGGKGGGTPIS